MKLAMVNAAQRHSKLIAHLASQGTRLDKPQMMGVGRLPATDDVGLCGHKIPMTLVANPQRLRPHAMDCLAKDFHLIDHLFSRWF
jgi:hypothetical protein